MKIKKQNKTKYKFLKTYLMMLQTYLSEVNSSSKLNLTSFLDKKVEIIELHFKVAFKIIQDYHVNNRKIVFIGRSSIKNTIFNSILNKSSHKYIETSTWTSGIFKSCYTNFQATIQKNPSSLKQKKSILDLYQKPDLVVILELEIEPKILKEISQLKVPTLGFKNDVFVNYFITYKIIGDFSALENRIPLNIYTFLLYSLLKKKRKTLTTVNLSKK
jgi:hypothetical protein